MAQDVDIAAGIGIIAADDRHLDAMMAIMHVAFDPQYGEAWSAMQLAGTLNMSGSWARLALRGTQTTGFSLCRAIGPDVELLLVAVAPDERQRGIGARLLLRAQEDALARGAKHLFLEVREDNDAARYLYQSAGFIDVGRRPDYYSGKDGCKRAALTMRFDLRDFDLS